MPARFVCGRCHSIFEEEGVCLECNELLQPLLPYDMAIDKSMDSMKRQIKQLGAEKCWAMIDRTYHNAITRARIRLIFYKAMDELGYNYHKE